MPKKITLICVILMCLSNTDAFLNGLFKAISYVNPLNMSPSKALRGLGNDELSGVRHSHHDVDFQMDEIQDNFTLQKAILQVRLKAAKRFIQSRSDLLRHIEDDHWKVNEAIVYSKRHDLEVAKNDVKIFEEAIENLSQFRNSMLNAD